MSQKDNIHRTTLFLDENLVIKGKTLAAIEQTSLSNIVNDLLAKRLAATIDVDDPGDQLTDQRSLRDLADNQDSSND